MKMYIPEDTKQITVSLQETPVFRIYNNPDYYKSRSKTFLAVKFLGGDAVLETSLHLREEITITQELPTGSLVRMVITGVPPRKGEKSPVVQIIVNDSLQPALSF